MVASSKSTDRSLCGAFHRWWRRILGRADPEIAHVIGELVPIVLESPAIARGPLEIRFEDLDAGTLAGRRVSGLASAVVLIVA